MKHPDSDDIQDKLASGPLRRQGFSSELQRKIEATADQTGRSRPRLKRLLWLGAAGTLCAAALIFPWNTLQGGSEAASGALNASSAVQPTTVFTPPPISSALLIGLRTEQEYADAKRTLSPIRYSTYRTMLIAPVRGHLLVTSEGSGILMPYKRDFWKIDSLVRKTATDEYHYLSAHLADEQARQEVFTDDPQEELNHVETLVFAGNQYVSVVESEESRAGNAPYQSQRIWVRTLPQLAEAASDRFAEHPTDNRHVALSDVFGDSAAAMLDGLSGDRKLSRFPTEISGQSWTIVRQPGAWTAKVAETFLPSSLNPGSYMMHDLPKSLPEKVVSYDKLCCDWSDIKKSWPEATDALMSPMNDMIAIFEQGMLNFYSYGRAPNEAPLLSVKLQPGEQLVMAQWATDHYVQDWIDRVSAYLTDLNGSAKSLPAHP